MYGIGSKIDFINLFCQKQLMISDSAVIIFNGYHTNCTIKQIIKKIHDWFRMIAFKNSLKDAEFVKLFPKNVSIYEQVAQIKQ